MGEYAAATGKFSFFLKYAWLLASVVFILAAFYAHPYYYFPLGAASGGYWVYHYYWKARGNA